MKKKLLVLVLIMGMIFSVVGCASSPQAATTTLSTTINTQTAAESSTAISKT